MQHQKEQLCLFAKLWRSTLLAVPKGGAGKTKVGQMGSDEQVWINWECRKTSRRGSDRRAGGCVGPGGGSEKSLVEVARADGQGGVDELHH